MMKLEEERKKKGIEFLGYFVEEANPLKRINMIIDKFDELYNKFVVEEERPTKLSPKRPSGIEISKPSPDTILVCHAPLESPPK